MSDENIKGMPEEETAELQGKEITEVEVADLPCLRVDSRGSSQGLCSLQTAVPPTIRQP